MLSVEAEDKIHNCIDLLCEQGYISPEPTLKETYEKVIGVYKLEREAPAMWKMIWEHKITSLFQMEQQSGIQGIALTHPRTVDELAILNSVIRLMAQGKGEEQPLDKYARFKSNISLWYDEMKNYGLTKEEMEILKPIVGISYGICESQEKFMQLVMLPECGGFSLNWADKLRKSIAKKNPAAFDALEKEYFQVIKEKGLSENLCKYVWSVLISSHTLAYSIVALQEMNLAYRFPLIFWNCACLISDCNGSGLELGEEREDDAEDVEALEDTEEDYIEDFDDEDDENDEITVKASASNKKKKKTKNTDYGKIASAIGKMRAEGITIKLPNINTSTLTFSPNVESNAIYYGLTGITKIGTDLVKSLIENRPYSSINDILVKNKINKTQMINLIKCGALDEFGNRRALMEEYVGSICGKKNKLTLQNMPTLITYRLIPPNMDEYRKLYNFNKYLKSFPEGDYYLLDMRAIKYLNENTEIDDESFVKYSGNSEDILCKIEKKLWDKTYKKGMEPMRQFLKNDSSILESLNKTLFNEIWNKSCTGSISKWEMDSISFYSHQHELTKATIKHHFDNFFNIPEEPVVERTLSIKGKQVPFYQLSRIAGTVLDKNKLKNLITILTTNGVVNVKVWQNQFVLYDKQISVRDEVTNKKKVIEKSWFSRGNKLIVTGIRRGDTFIPKVYKNSPWRAPIELIDSINEETGDITTRSERLEI